MPALRETLSAAHVLARVGPVCRRGRSSDSSLPGRAFPAALAAVSDVLRLGWPSCGDGRRFTAAGLSGIFTRFPIKRLAGKHRTAALQI